MRYAVDAKGAVGVDLLGLVEERVIDDALANVAFHVRRSFFFLVRVDQTLDHIERGRIFELHRVLAPFLTPSCTAIVDVSLEFW